MDHDIGSIENVMPIGNVLDVDKIYHATVDKTVKDIACTTANDEAKTNIFITLDG